VELGLTYKYLYRCFVYTDNSYGWDFGLRLRLDDRPLFIGFQIQNFHCKNIKPPKLGEDTFPYLIRGGISYAFTFPHWQKKCVLNIDVDGMEGISWKHFDYKAGILYSPQKPIQIIDILKIVGIVSVDVSREVEGYAAINVVELL